MGESIRLKYTPTQQDYAQVLRLFLWQRTATRVSLVFLVIALGLVIYAIATQGAPPSLFELVWLLLPPLFVGYVFFIQPNRMASQAIKNEQLATEATWEIGESGVEISSQFGSILMEWDSLSKLVTTKDYYLLLSKTNKNAFRFLPRRTFTSAQQQELFIKTMSEHIVIR